MCLPVRLILPIQQQQPPHEAAQVDCNVLRVCVKEIGRRKENGERGEKAVGLVRVLFRLVLSCLALFLGGFIVLE